MDELARLMEELSLALKARAEAGVRTEALAREVRALPKLSVLAPSATAVAAAAAAEIGLDINGEPELESERERESNTKIEQGKESDDLLERLQLQLELQNLSHSKQLALEFLQSTTEIVAQVRQAVSQTAVQLDYQSLDIFEDYDSRIQAEKQRYAELRQQKQDLLFGLMRKAEKLEDLIRRASKATRKSSPREEETPRATAPVECPTERTPAR